MIGAGIVHAHAGRDGGILFLALTALALLWLAWLARRGPCLHTGPTLIDSVLSKPRAWARAALVDSALSTHGCCRAALVDPDQTIAWNPYNRVVQCHACGTVYWPEPPGPHDAIDDRPVDSTLSTDRRTA